MGTYEFIKNYVFPFINYILLLIKYGYFFKFYIKMLTRPPEALQI